MRVIEIADQLSRDNRDSVGRRTGQTVRPALAATVLDGAAGSEPPVESGGRAASELDATRRGRARRRRRRRKADRRAGAAQRKRRRPKGRRETGGQELARVYAEREQLAYRLVLAQTDPLTGTYTRAAGLEALDRELARSRRTGSPLVVAYIDVVGLKCVNDGEGHAAGDALLQTIVRHIRGQLRPYDLVVRLGGDEFLCAMPNMALSDARRRFADVNATLAAAPDAGAIRTGLAQWGPDEDAIELVARADAEMVSKRRHSRDPAASTVPRPGSSPERAPAPSLTLTLAGGSLAPARARAALAVFMDAMTPAELGVLRLTITELVTNSVVHGGAGPADPISVQVTVRRHTIRAEVSDTGPGFTPPRLFAARDVGGLGLVIVNRCAARWGTTHHGQRVWFELDRAPPADAGGACPGS